MAAKRPRQQEMRGAQVDGDMASSSSATLLDASRGRPL